MSTIYTPVLPTMSITAGMVPNLSVVILAGGEGSRLFPLSTPEKPKQFRALTSHRKMIQETFARVAEPLPEVMAVSPENVYVLTQNEYVDITARQLPNLPRENIIAGPFRKGTGPAMSVAAHEIGIRDPDAVIAFLPSDHWIGSTVLFRKDLLAGVRVAVENDAMVTFGVTPTRPAETGFGYIETDDVFKGQARVVRSFREKPNSELAKALVESGHCWNSGIYMCRAQVYKDMLHEFDPAMFAQLCSALSCFDVDWPMVDTSYARFFELVRDVRVEHSIVEPAAKKGKVLMLPLTPRWSDVGTPESLGSLATTGEITPPQDVLQYLVEHGFATMIEAVPN